MTHPHTQTQSNPTAALSTFSQSQQSMLVDVDMEEDSTQLNSQQNLPSGTPANSRKTTKVFWTSEMESAALELYVQAVREGKRSDNGFKPETHRAIAAALQIKFPTVDLDEKKVKSKFNQVSSSRLWIFCRIGLNCQ